MIAQECYISDLSVNLAQVKRFINTVGTEIVNTFNTRGPFQFEAHGLATIRYVKSFEKLWDSIESDESLYFPLLQENAQQILL